MNRIIQGDRIHGPRYAVQLIEGKAELACADSAVVRGWGYGSADHDDRAEEREAAWFDAAFAKRIEEMESEMPASEQREWTIFHGLAGAAAVLVSIAGIYFMMRPTYVLASEATVAHDAIRDVIQQNTETWKMMRSSSEAAIARQERSDIRNEERHLALMDQIGDVAEKLTAALTALSERVTRNEVRIEAMQAARKRGDISSTTKHFPPVNPGALSAPAKPDESRARSGPHYAGRGAADWRWD